MSSASIKAVVVMLLYIVHPARGEAQCSMPSAEPNDALSLGRQWSESITRFINLHPELDEDQVSFLVEGLAIGNPSTFELGKSRALWLKRHGAALAAFVARSEDLLTPDQRGELFAGMGSVQSWLGNTRLLQFPPNYCSCVNVGGACQRGEEKGTCRSNGCTAWSNSGNNVAGECEYGGGNEPPIVTEAI